MQLHLEKSNAQFMICIKRLLLQIFTRNNCEKPFQWGTNQRLLYKLFDLTNKKLNE